jgi:hypothetical protein
MRSASISLISRHTVDKLSAEILQAIVMMNKRCIPPTINHLVDATSATSRPSVQTRLAMLERYGYINRKRLGKFARIVVLKSSPKVLNFVDLDSVSRSKVKQARKKNLKDYRKSREAECFERAVKLGLKRDADEAKTKRDGVFHDGHPLFWNGVLRASKVG